MPGPFGFSGSICSSALASSASASSWVHSALYRRTCFPLIWAVKPQALRLVRWPGIFRSAAVLDGALGSAVISAEFTALVLNKGEGNPFFLEELARALTERHEDDGVVAVPDTVQGVLAARIDRLPEEDKRLLESASVLGREFPLSLLAAVWQGNGLLLSRLRELAHSDFLYESGSADGPSTCSSTR